VNRAVLQSAEGRRARGVIAGFGNLQVVGFGDDAEFSGPGSQLQPKVREVAPAIEETNILPVPDRDPLDGFSVTDIS
jgi:hypothetical protein